MIYLYRLNKFKYIIEKDNKYNKYKLFDLYRYIINRGVCNVEFIYGYLLDEDRTKIVTNNFFKCYNINKTLFYCNGSVHDWLWSACMISPHTFNTDFWCNYVMNNKYHSDEVINEFKKLNHLWIELL